MTQPDYVPILPSDRVRPSARLSVPGPWTLDRPAEQVGLVPPSGDRFGTPGPNLGYGLKLAKRFEGRLALAPGEVAADAVAACFACGARRASSFGRAPVIHDLSWAYTLWGYLGDPPPDLVAARAAFLRGASHHYEVQRRVVDAVALATLSLTPAQVGERLESWRGLVTIA